MVSRNNESSNTATIATNATTATTTILGNDNKQLGVFVDKTSYDGEDDLKDIPQVVEEERCHSDNEGVVMKNGKIRRKLKWKPPSFRKKKNANKPSSNSSVVSALTNKSTSTNRSNSTNRSFLSHFSRKSQNSFHTFHSTETPVVTNKATRPTAPYTVKRPNYRDTFENAPGPSTIENDGKGYVHTKRTGSNVSHLGIVDEPFERSSTLPSRLDGMNIPHSAMVKPFDPYGGSAASLNSDPFDALEDVDVILPPVKQTKKNKKGKRPPLFKRKLRISGNNAKKDGMQSTGTSPEEGSQASSTNNSSDSPVAANCTAPTITSSTSPLDSVVSLEREPSVLPALEAEDFEQDRRVCLGTPPRHQRDFAGSVVDDGTCDSAPTPLPSRNSPSHTSSTSPDCAATAESPSSRHSSPRKSYNRPVDRTDTIGDVITTTSDCEIEAQQAPDILLDKQPLQRRPSIPVDLDDGAFLEAEHNLRAIHEMAAEHLAHDEYEEAIEVFEEILRAQKERYGQKHYRVGTALHNLGVLHMKRQDYGEAIAMFNEAVEVRRESLVPNHPDVAISLAQLGVANLESGNYKDALLPFREALTIRQTFLGPRHPKCSKLLNNIGCVLYSLDELDDANTVFQEALDIQRETLRLMPSSDEAQESYAQSNSILLSMASTLCNLASINLKKRQFEEANVALEEALLIQQSVLGDEHPVVGSTMDSIEFVETSKNNALFSSQLGWGTFESTKGDASVVNDNGMCRVEPGIHDVLGVNSMFSSLSPKSWLQKMENVFTDNSCGPDTTYDTAAASVEANSVSASDTVLHDTKSSNSRYSV